jgi:hypothetical protein
MKKLFFPAIAMIAILFSGCSRVPDVQIDAATASVEAAKSVEADRYLATEYQMLVDSLDAVLASIESEQAKSVGSRDFKPFVEKLTNLTAQAETVKANAEIQKAQVRIEVQDAITSLNNLVAENKTLLQQIKVNPKNKESVETMQNDVTIIEASINELNTLVNNGDYLTALQKVKENNAKVIAMNTELKIVK